MTLNVKLCALCELPFPIGVPLSPSLYLQPRPRSQSAMQLSTDLTSYRLSR